MKTRIATSLVVLSLLGLPLLLAGCDREVSRTSQTKVDSNGNAKTKETVVKQAPDGTVTKEESTTTTTTNNPWPR